MQQRCLWNLLSWLQVFHYCNLFSFGFWKISGTHDHLYVWKNSCISDSQCFSLMEYRSGQQRLENCTNILWMIRNSRRPFLPKKDVQLSLIVFVDGHKAHLTSETSELCKYIQIILITLYPNATHILQPGEVAAFRPLKAQWSKAFLRSSRTNHIEAVTKVNIVPLLKIVVESDMMMAIKNDFRSDFIHLMSTL